MLETLACLKIDKYDVWTESHIYTDCTRLESFWREARDWMFITWGVLAPLNLKCTRLFGMEKERTDNLLNI